MNLFFSWKKKVITQTEQTIDYSLATIEEKKNLSKVLFINQKELVILTINYLNPSSEVLIYFMFIVALWESVFSGFLHHHIPNQIIGSDFFFKFLCYKVGWINDSRVHHVFSHHRTGVGSPIAGGKKYLTTVDLPPEVEAKFLEKRTLTSKEKSFLDKNMNIEKKLMIGEYSNLRKMATNINDGTPSKEIEDVVFRDIMKIMLNEFKN